MIFFKPFAIVCVLPLVSCALAGKVGLSVNGEPAGGSSSAPQTGGSNAQAPSTQPIASPENPPAGVPNTGLLATPARATTPMKQPVEVAGAVEDSVSAIPASMRVSPSKGAPVIAMRGPSWCGSVSRENRWDKTKSTENEFRGAIEDISDIYETTAMSNIAEFACAGSRSANRFSWVRAYMQARANASGMSEEHQAFLFSVVAAKSLSSTPKNCESYELKGENTTLQKYHNQAFMVGMGCSRSGEGNSLTWWLDREIEIDSHVKRLAFVYSVFKDAGNSLSYGLSALHDVKLINFDAYFAEMRKFGADDTQLARGMMKYYDFQYLYRQWHAYNEKEYGKDFRFVKKAASDGFDGWASEYRANSEAVKFAFGIEEAVLKGDKSKFSGCSVKANGFVRKLVLQNKPKSVEDVVAAGSHGIASLVLIAAYECEKNNGNAIMARGYVDMLEKMEQTRGPRYAARIAAHKAVKKAKEKNSSFSIRGNFVPPRYYDAFGDVRAANPSASIGIIKRIVRKGKFLEVQFEDVVRNDRHYNCVRTGIRGVHSSGRFKRSQKCTNARSTRDVIKVDPISIPKEAGKGLKKGYYATIAQREGNPSVGYPVKVYKSKDEKVLVNYYGMAL
ncbi:MAG: hypothetical protein JKY56_22070 [Kofleriaceae bacterium]|nr:hypothetical protein [Kofleriaceae bacterium]